MQQVLTRKLLSDCISINHILVLRDQTDQAGEYAELAADKAADRGNHGEGRRRRSMQPPRIRAGAEPLLHSPPIPDVNQR